jgi:hypothetical protein
LELLCVSICRRNTFTDEFDFTPEIAKVVKAAKVAKNIGRDLAKKQRGTWLAGNSSSLWYYR